MKHLLLCAALLGTALWLRPALAADTDKKSTKGDETKIDDKTFVMRAADAGMAEVSLGMLATRQGSTADVRKFGQRMVTDHTAANRQLLALAGRKGFAIPRQISRKHQDAMTKLARRTGAAFDRAYADQMVKDHEKAVALFEAEAKHGRDADLKAFAAKTLPTLRHHLKMARNMTGTAKAKER